MTDALKEAAEEASAATGQPLQIVDQESRTRPTSTWIERARDDVTVTGDTLITLEIPAKGNRGATVIRASLTPEAALAYLEGLAQGAHISNVRARGVLCIALAEMIDMNAELRGMGHGRPCVGAHPDCAIDVVRVALKELEE